MIERSRTGVLAKMGLAMMLTAGTLTVWSGASSWDASNAPCTSRQLSFVLASGGAGVGHIGLIIEFKNKSVMTCTLSGYPKLVFQSASGTTTVVARQTQNGYLGGLGHTTKKRALPSVTLHAMTGVASSFIEGTDVSVGTAASCVSFTKILLTMPGFKKPYHFDTKFPGCSTPQVHPIVKGPTGQMA